MARRLKHKRLTARRTVHGENMEERLLYVKMEVDGRTKTRRMRVPELTTMTVGWLLAEVTKLYSATCSKFGAQQKKLVVGLKSEKGIPTLDAYLTDLSK